MENRIEQTSLFALPILEGENVSLIPFFDVFDMDDFIRLHMEDKKGYMCRFSLKDLNRNQAEEYINALITSGEVFIWTVMLKDGGNKVGFIYLSNVDNRSASINGIMDKESIRFLDLKLKKSLADEATLVALYFCFNNGFERITGDATEDNKQALALHKRLGFVREGVLREAIKIDGNTKNIVLVSVLKKEFTNGKIVVSTKL